jgi:predicted small secreted protein
MKAPVILVLVAIVMASCSKTSQGLSKDSAAGESSGQFTKYTIQKGNQYCDGNGYKPIELTEMKFLARFDSTAIYQTQSVENQYDINKLYGFSDNNSDHHQYSARFGWRWSDKALRLFAYVYNGGTVISKELATVMIGAEVDCSIKISGDNYLFTVDGTTTSMPRIATTDKAKGYQLYPYFGGDESAPHQINIWIKNF